MSRKWPLVPLGQVLTSYVGGVWGEDQWAEGLVPVRSLRGIDLAGMLERRAVDVPRRWVTLKQREPRVLKPGDLVIEASGTNCGRSIVLNHSQCESQGDPLVFSNFCRRFSVQDDLADPQFIGYFLRSAFSRGEIQTFRTGSAMPNLDVAALLEGLHVPLAPLAEQRRIAAVLGALDDLIETNQRLVRNLEALAQSLFLRLMAEGPTTATVPLSSTVEILSGGTPRTSVSSYWGGSIPWYSVVDAPEEHQVWVLETAKSITDEGLASSPSRLLPVGATILSARGTVGKVALVATPMAMNQSCYALRSHHGQRGFYNFFLIRSVVYELQRNAHGSVFDTITRATLDGVMVPDRSPQIIKKFETDVAPYLDQMLALLRENSKMGRVRDELLPLLLSGRVSVREVAA